MRSGCLFSGIQPWKEHPGRTRDPSDSGRFRAPTSEAQPSFSMRIEAGMPHRDNLGSLYPVQRHSPLSIPLGTTHTDNVPACLSWENGAFQPWTRKLPPFLLVGSFLSCSEVLEREPSSSHTGQGTRTEHHVAAVVSLSEAWPPQLPGNEPWMLLGS